MTTERAGLQEACVFVPNHEPWTCSVHHGVRTNLDEPECDAIRPAQPLTPGQIANLRAWDAEGRVPHSRYIVRGLLAALATPDEPVAGLGQLLREAAETIHQTGSLRDHSDPNDMTGWHVHGIETCRDPLCVDLLQAAARLEGDAMTIQRAGLRELTDSRYPAATPEGPRTPWQDGWNAAMDAVDAILLATPDEPVAGLGVERLRDWVMAHAGWAEGGASMMAFDRQLEAALATPDEPVAGLDVVFAVVFSNYEPAEVNSIWATEELANEQADSLNANTDWEAWEVRRWPVARLREDVPGDEG